MGSDFKELQELLKFGFDIQKAISMSLAGDGVVNFRDLPFFLLPFQSAGAAFKNLGNPLRRYRMLSDQERLQLIAWAKSEFQLNKANVEDLIEDTLDVAYSNIALVRRWIEFSK